MDSNTFLFKVKKVAKWILASRIAYYSLVFSGRSPGTVLLAKSDSDSDVLFIKFIMDLESIDHLCINPIRRI